MPDPGENIYSWSPIALDNGTADSAIAWPEGQTRASVNNSARSMMAALAKDRDLQTGIIVTTGTANAQEFASGALVPYTTVPTGMRVLLKIGPTLTNTGAATLNMDGIGAVAIKYSDGTDIEAGALVADGYGEFIYNGTNWIFSTLSPTQITNIINNTTVTIASTEVTTITGPVTTIDFTTGFDGTFSEYVFVITNLVVATDNAELWVHVSLDAGATFKAGANDYRWTRDVIFDGDNTWAGATYAFTGSPVGDAAIRMTGPWLSANALHPAGGEVRFFAPDLAAVNTMQWQISFRDQATFLDLYRGVGRYTEVAGAAINGIRFLLSTGQITTATIQMYGIKK